MMVNFTKGLPQLVAKARAVGRRLPGVGILLVSFLLVQEASASACRVSLSQSLVDYGLMGGGGHPANQGISIGKRTVRLNVTCSGASVIAMRFQGAPADGQGYMFGRQGYFNLTLLHPTLDGKPVELAQWYNHSERSGALLPGQALVALAGGVPATGRNFSAQVQIESWLSSAAIAVRDRTTLEGSGRFELITGG